MPSCFVCGRTENQKSKSDNISFHRFPAKECIRKKWDDFLEENCLNSKNVTKYSVICSSHFHESCFTIKQSRKLLLKHVFPSIVVGRIKSAKQLYTESYKHITIPKKEEDGILQFDRTLVNISTTSDVELGVFPLDEPLTSSNIGKSDVQNKNILLPVKEEEVFSMNEPSTSSYGMSEKLSDEVDENKMNKSECALITASEVNIEDTPRRRFLKRSIRQLSQGMFLKNKKLKSLQQNLRRKEKQIANMQTIINDLKNQNLINEETSYTLLESFGKHKDLLNNWTKKNLGKKIPKKYSPTIRQFALSLHFFSVKAYEYVREQFNTILPHPRTLSKWYRHLNAEPGFTSESLKMLELKVKNSPHTVFGALVMDEMAIRQHLEYERSTGKYYGRVDMGSGMDNDSLEVAKECLVFLVVSVNENWKLPIGYFLAHSLNSAQKVGLVRHALNVLSNTGVSIISLTFDGCSTNITAAKLLGCNFTIDALNTSIASECYTSKIEAIFDPAHMIKLVRNAFGEKKIFLDYNNNEINFEYVEQLCYLQEKEGCHLANKLRKNHILFFKQKMKVKLATQLLSQSVADALKFCKDNLKLQEFKNAGATITFIELFNQAFDILNSRSLNCVEYKKALCNENIEEIRMFINNFNTYIIGLKIKDRNDFILVLQSNRKTGFIGFIVSFNSLLQLYSTLIESNKLSHIKAYKLSQDHLELFFCSVRSHGGFNNNPTVRQFRSAYKKLVIRTTDIKQFNTGNCIPLEDIDILHYSSIDPVKVLNNNSININSDDIIEEENVQNINSFIMDHDYIGSHSDYSFSNFSKEIIIYIAGFVVHKLTNTLKCDTCKYALCAIDREYFLNSLINPFSPHVHYNVHTF